MADQLQPTPTGRSPLQRIQNWITRGVPRHAWPEIAQALGKSIDWVAGTVAPPPEEIVLTEQEKRIILTLRAIAAEEAEAEGLIERPLSVHPQRRKAA